MQVGDNVKVKTGVKDVDFGIDISGWQGRIIEVRDGTMMVAWDSITLRDIPVDVITKSEEKGLDWAFYGCDSKELEPTQARDTQADVEQTIKDLEKRHTWDWIGEEGELTRQILTGLDPDDDVALIEAWDAYLQAHLTLPFEAAVDEVQERGPLQAGHRVRVHLITDADEFYGIIVRLHHGRQQYDFPLCDLEAVDETSENHTIITNYRVWFANR